MMKCIVSISVDVDVIVAAREKNLNVSKFCNDELREMLFKPQPIPSALEMEKETKEQDKAAKMREKICLAGQQPLVNEAMQKQQEAFKKAQQEAIKEGKTYVLLRHILDNHFEAYKACERENNNKRKLMPHEKWQKILIACVEKKIKKKVSPRQPPFQKKPNKAIRVKEIKVKA